MSDGGYKHIFEQIISLDNLLLAWRKFKRGKKNKAEIQEFEFNLEANLFELHCQLAEMTYKHGTYTGFYINDPKIRHIHKANIRDRILHHAIFNVLNPIFEPTFIANSFSCRVGKGTHRGVEALYNTARKVSQNYSGNCFALKCDIRKFFDSVNHQILKDIIARRVKDIRALKLCEEIIDSFCAENPRERERESTGIPIGNLTSQLFANIYLNEFDQFIKHKLKVKYYFRYTDDFIILSQNENYLKQVLLEIQKFLQENLKLNLHPNKVTIRKLRQGIDFLGYVVLPYHKVLRTKTKRRILKRANAKNLQSYLGVLKHCNGYKIKQNLLKSIKV